MFHRLSTNTLNLLMIIGVILFVVEIAFFMGGMILSALFSILLIYIGRKYFHRLSGKIFFWIGAIGLFFSVLNMIAVRFFIIAGIILFIIDFNRSRKHKEQIRPIIPMQENNETEPLIQVKPLFDYHLFGEQKTKDTAYEWHDLNIHSAYGDKVIDLSNTVLPDDVAVISIRQLVGNIEIYIPYEVEVSIHHSSVFGRARIFGKYHGKLMNESLLYETERYGSGSQRVKIITTLFSGDIEVKRI